MVAFLVLFLLFKPNLRRLSSTSPKYPAWSLKERLQLFRMGGLSCGILYLFVNRTSSVFEGFNPSPFAIVLSDSVLNLAVIFIHSTRSARYDVMPGPRMAWLYMVEDCFMSGDWTVPGCGFYSRIVVVLMTVLPIMWSGLLSIHAIPQF